MPATLARICNQEIRRTLTARRSASRSWRTDGPARAWEAPARGQFDARALTAAQGARRWCWDIPAPSPIDPGQYAAVTVAYDRDTHQFTHVRAVAYSEHRHARAAATRTRKKYPAHWTVTVHRSDDDTITVYDEQRRVVHTEPF